MVIHIDGVQENTFESRDSPRRLEDLITIRQYYRMHYIYIYIYLIYIKHILSSN